MTTQIAMNKPSSESQPQGPEMSDRDRINDVLSFEKYITQGYNTGLNEMQNPSLHQTVQNILIDAHKTQFQIFDQMWQKGWYKLKAAEQQEISQAHQQFTDYKTQFPKF